MALSYYIATLGCPKNEVDSAKLAGRLVASGYEEVSRPGDADLVVVNTCAFIEPAREESIETILEMSEARRPGARLAVTGCLAERSGAELAAALPEVDVVAGFGVEFADLVGSTPVAFRPRSSVPAFDLLELPRPAATAPWAYVKVAEGCDRRCGFCAIPSFRGPQRSRDVASILAEVEALDVREIVLVAQDLASYGRDVGSRSARGGLAAQSDGIVELLTAVAERVSWVRLLYLYPSSLTDGLIDAILATGVPYFDLSLQHVSAPLVRRMRRFGNGAKFLERIARIRALEPRAAMRSSFILGYPGETEEDHDELLGFLEDAQLDWAGFFSFSPEAGTFAASLEGQIDPSLALERLVECTELQDSITARRRAALVGEDVEVLIERPGVGRTFREAPDIDGVVRVSDELAVGSFATVPIVDCLGPDLVGGVLVG